MKLLIVFISVFCFYVVGIGQSTKQGWNEYGAHPVLKWKDFKGVNPNKSSYTAAEVNTSLEFQWAYEIEGTNIEFLYKVFAMQNPKASWVEITQKTNRVLAHEQLHFDITELHARMFRKWLSEFEYLTTRNLRRRLNTKYTNVKIAWKEMQQAYDRDTNHGISAVEQAKWEKKINDLMSKYIEFKS